MLMAFVVFPVGLAVLLTLLMSFETDGKLFLFLSSIAEIVAMLLSMFFFYLIFFVFRLKTINVYVIFTISGIVLLNILKVRGAIQFKPDSYYFMIGETLMQNVFLIFVPVLYLWLLRRKNTIKIGTATYKNENLYKQ